MIWFENHLEFLRVAYEVDKLANTLEKELLKCETINGYCDKCNGTTNLLNRPAGDQWTDSRGQFCCESCGFYARLRLFWAAMQSLDPINMFFGKRVLLAEAVTSFARAAKAVYPNIICSEFISDVPTGSVVSRKGVEFICEDLMNLTFEDESVDFLFHQDVLEHVPDADLALQEMCRVLRPGGITLFTAPFFHLREQGDVRARMVDGKIVHGMEPVYHGNPLSEEGALVFESFGMDFFLRCKDMGFSKCEIGLNYDIVRGFISNGNPYSIGRMLPIIFKFQK